MLAIEALREFLAPWGGISDTYVVDNNTTVEEPVRRGERKILLIEFDERTDDVLLYVLVCLKVTGAAARSFSTAAHPLGWWPVCQLLSLYSLFSVAITP